MFSDISIPALMGQIVLGLINGSFYALLSLGLAVIFGMLRVINFAHGAQYMMGAYFGWMALNYLGINYWAALLIAPLLVGLVSIVIERALLSRIYHIEHLYGLLLTFGVALFIEGIFRSFYGTAGQGYQIPAALQGVLNLGFVFIPIYRAWVIVASLVICVVTWLVIERTNLGSYLRAATENPALVQAFGINVPRLMTLTYALGAALAGLAGVFAAPIYQVNPLMGQNLMVVVFAVVVIGGMGSIIGAVVAGYALGILEGLTKYFYPEASSTVIFAAMILILLLRPTGLMGRELGDGPPADEPPQGTLVTGSFARLLVLAAGLLVIVLAPFVVYPIHLMNVLCFSIFALSFNLLFGYSGLLSFGHAAFFGGASYVTGYVAKEWGLSPEMSIAVGVAFSVMLGVLIGGVALRRRGIYFAMITLALAQMFYFICLQAPFTGGENGLQNIPRGRLFGLIPLDDNLPMYYFVAAVFLVVVAAIYRIINSPFGDTVRAIRDNEQRAISLGYSVRRYQLAIFVMSSAFAGLAGCMKALVFQFASLTDVSWHISGEVILMVLVGGVGTIIGPIVGSAIVLTVTDFFSTHAVPVPVALGVLFVVCVVAFRSGVVGAFQGYARSLSRHMERGKPVAKPILKTTKGERS